MEPNLFDDFHMNSDFTENYTDIWSDNGHQAFESELSNNLQGILPLFGNNNNHHFDHEQDMVAKICQSENQYFEASSSPTVEIIQVDPNEYGDDSDDDDGVLTESSYDETSSFYDSEADDKRLEPTIQDVGGGDDDNDSYSSSSDDENWPAPAIEAVRPVVGQKRIHRQSFSLPDSPVHRPPDDLMSVQPSLTFEDLNLPKSWSPEPPKRVPPLKLKNLASLSQLNIIETKSKRQCVKKNNYKTTLSKPNLESDDSNLSEVDVGIETAIFSDSKRQPDVVQSKDNFKEDPTWSPTKLPTATVVGAREAKKGAGVVTPKAVGNSKQKPVKPVATPSSSTSSNTPPLMVKSSSSSATIAKAPATKLLKVNPINNGVAKTKVGLLNAAGKYSKNMLNAVTKPLKPTSKLDHDYCTLKRQTSSKPTIATLPRKTIEIPIDFNAVSKQKPRKNQRKNGGNSAPTTAKLATKKVSDTTTVKAEEPPAKVQPPKGATDAAGASTKNGDSKKCDSNANNANNCPEPTKFKSNSCNSTETSNSDLLPPAQAETVVVPSVEVAKKTPKKKLNLAEYKKRRDGTAIDQTPAQPNAIKCENSAPLVASQPQAVPTTAPTATVVTKNETNAGAPKVKTFLNVNNKNQYVDPISAAQKKVLRQHALKKQALEKSVEAQILKATPLLPILPLAELAGCAKSSADKEPAQKEYEEIIVVSIACNTEVTIPINTATETLAELYSCNNGENISANSLLSSIQDVVIKKSSMDQVPATLVVATSTGSGQISPNIGVSPPNQFSPGKPETSKSDSVSKVTAKASPEEATVEDGHGEDKVIMHLKKGRVMPRTFSAACQTVNLPQFPLLKRLRPLASKNGHRRDKRKRNYRMRSASRSSDRSDVESAVVRREARSRDSRKSSSPETTRRRRYSSRSNSGHSRSSRSYDRRTRTRSRTSSRRQSSRSSSRSQYDRRSTLSRSVSRASEEGSSKNRSRYHQHQRNGSRKRYRNCSTSSGSESSSYSSRSKSRSRSVSPKRRKMMADRAKSPDERRIVYVGRIENELTKDELKQKFINYGDIKQVTLHFKDSGIRYGFVTFDKPQDAFAAIDASTKDTNINMYDISFGGRRQFCRAQYSDLDGLATTTTHDPVMSVPYFAPREEKKEESFEEMLKKLKAKMSARQS